MQNKVLKKVASLLIIGLAANSVYANSSIDSPSAMEQQFQSISVSTSQAGLDNALDEAVINPNEQNVKNYLSLKSKTEHKSVSFAKS